MTKKDLTFLKKELKGKKILEMSIYSNEDSIPSAIVWDDMEDFEYDSDCYKFLKKIEEKESTSSRCVNLIRTLFPNVGIIYAYINVYDNMYNMKHHIEKNKWILMKDGTIPTYDCSCRYIFSIDDENFEYESLSGQEINGFKFE